MNISFDFKPYKSLDFQGFPTSVFYHTIYFLYNIQIHHILHKKDYLQSGILNSNLSYFDKFPAQMEQMYNRRPAAPQWRPPQARDMPRN